MPKLLPLLLLLLLFACIFQRPALSQVDQGPYIDSLGFRAAQARLENVDRADGNALISQAFYVPKTTAEQSNQAEFFQSIEESYQRYVKLFTTAKRTSRPEIRCDYDLCETFKLQLFDPQPFINAMLHTMSLTELSTLDFVVQPRNADTLFVQVSYAKATARKDEKEFAIGEGDLTLTVTRHTAALVTFLH
jgi:hypothetical protein